VEWEVAVDTGANSNIIIRIKVLSSSERNIQQIPLEPTNMNCTERNDCLARSFFPLKKSQQNNQQKRVWMKKRKSTNSSALFSKAWLKVCLVNLKEHESFMNP